MSFKDIFKSSFLNGFQSTGIDIKTTIVCLGITAVLAIFVFIIYKAITRKTFYSTSFNISLIAMALITSAIILTIQSNIVISLGMVGALSIVRFRTAIKDPLDLVFLYWSISIGIICGAGLAEIAVLLSVVIAIVLFIMQYFPGNQLSMLLVVNSLDSKVELELLNIIKRNCKNYKIKSKNLTESSFDIIIDVKLKSQNNLLEEVSNINGVFSASLISHDGEITA